MAREMIEEVVRAMRDWSDEVYDRHGDSATICEFADRVKTAARAHPSIDDYEKLREELRATRDRRDECEAKMYKAFERVTKAEAENVRLKAALKPVLECEDKWQGHWPFAGHAADAVNEAKRAYNESKGHGNDET